MYLRAFARLYAWTAPTTFVTKLGDGKSSVPRFVCWFWCTKTFYVARRPLTEGEQVAAFLLSLGMLLQLVTAVTLLVNWALFGTAGYWQFGLALLISYPVVWAHVLALAVVLWRGLYFVISPKKAGRAVVCTVLESQVKQLREKHKFTVVAVAGSVGKTSTKLAIAELLGQTKRVRHQTGNYNDRVTVPLVFFGLDAPNIFNVLAWLRIFRSNAATIRQPYAYDVVVVELGTDGPGFMQDFAYVKPDITVLTAITPEHMEYFKTLDAVADEELTVFDYSKQVLVNGDDIPGKYLAGREFTEYSLVSSEAAYFAVASGGGKSGQKLTMKLAGKSLTASTSYLGRQGAKFALAAGGVADMLGVKTSDISGGLPKLSHFAGRMQVLPGVKESTLIDDTYNASPVAVKAALDVLYGLKAPQHIAILGSMNELGSYSPEAHAEVGEYCSPKKLDLVVTIGTDAQHFLAPMAEAAGCSVKSFDSPYEAGRYVLEQLKNGAAVLAKGSQNGVFAEEALKQLLAEPTDAHKLVRQSEYWLSKKRQQFTDAPK